MCIRYVYIYIHKVVLIKEYNSIKDTIRIHVYIYIYMKTTVKNRRHFYSASFILAENKKSVETRERERERERENDEYKTAMKKNERTTNKRLVYMYWLKDTKEKKANRMNGYR